MSDIVRKETDLKNYRGGLPPKPCKDHRGNSYPSLSAMARAWGIADTTLLMRLKAGWSLKKALTTATGTVPFLKGQEVVDHLGQKFPSIRAAAAAWGLGPSCLSHRLKIWPLEKAFTEPVKGAYRIGAASEKQSLKRMQKQAKAAHGLARYCAGFPDGNTFKEIPCGR